MPTYCTIQDAYGSAWGSKPNKDKNIEKANEKREQVYQTADKPPEGGGLNSFCPNCKSCLEKNNQFQQMQVNQSLRPLPRWIPQSNDIHAFDPYNRIFNPYGREDFESTSYGKIEHFSNLSVNNAEKLLSLVLYLLIALFIIQLFEFIANLTSES